MYVSTCLGNKYLHADFVSPNNKGDFAAPRIDKTGPAGV